MDHASLLRQHGPTWALQAGGHHLLHVGAVEVGLHDAVQRDVRPEHQLVAVVEVQRDGVLQVVEQQRVLGAVRQHLADVDAVGEEQDRLRTWRGGGEEGCPPPRINNPGTFKSADEPFECLLS